MMTGLLVAPALLFAGLTDTTVLLALVLATALLVVAGWAHWRFWQGRLSLVDHYDEVVDLRLGDGITVQLRRLQPAVPSAEPPVLLVHGIAIDHRNLDVLPTVSLPRHLRAAGRDVWLLTLRSGMGLPRKKWPHIRFSRMVRHDVPEAIAEVLRRTGQSQLDYIGFSMGGMLAYAALGRTVPLHQVRRVVIQGSPGKVVPPLQVLRLLRWCPKTVWPALPIRLAAQMTAPWSEFLQTPAQSLVCNAGNMTPGAMRRVAAQGTHTISPALQYQLYQWAFPCGGTLILGGQPVLAGLAEVAVPVLFFAGRGDRLASPGAVATAFEAWGSNLSAPIRHLVVLDKVHAAADYGHLDLAAGREAAREVFAPIAAFLSSADPADPAGFLPTKLLPACRSGLTPYSRPAKAEAA